ncbi:MAG: NifU family protein [Eubacterium sp.]|nr:NifU family protein [Eubacterium sp.]
MEARVQEALEAIRPALQRDGGDLELAGITEDNVVQVRLQGHCVGCPGAQMTLKMIVEQILMEAVPEVKGVEAINFGMPMF